jgi:hypothetical protein
MVKLLRTAGADVKLKDAKGLSAEDWAEKAGSLAKGLSYRLTLRELRRR